MFTVVNLTAKCQFILTALSSRRPSGYEHPSSRYQRTTQPADDVFWLLMMAWQLAADECFIVAHGRHQRAEAGVRQVGQRGRTRDVDRLKLKPHDRMHA
eukprot:scaffold43303_cov26-Prasinocladus_malaysianus.AAC.1